MTREEEIEAHRILGARDGYIGALIRVRGKIGELAGPNSPGIHPRHVHKLAGRDRVLAPLRELERWLDAQQSECSRAFQEWTAETARATSA